MTAVGREMALGVVGAGTMGRGIVQLFAQAGYRVVLHDAAEGAAEQARGFIAGMFDRAAEKGRMTNAAAEAAKDRIALAGELRDLTGCGVVIEAIVEALEPKQQLFTLGVRNRGGGARAGARRRAALLQSGAADEGGGGDPRPAH